MPEEPGRHEDHARGAPSDGLSPTWWTPLSAWPPVAEVARRDGVTNQLPQVLRGGGIEIREHDDHKSKLGVDIEYVVDARASASVIHDSGIADTTDEKAEPIGLVRGIRPFLPGRDAFAPELGRR